MINRTFGVIFNERMILELIQTYQEKIADFNQDIHTLKVALEKMEMYNSTGRYTEKIQDCAFQIDRYIKAVEAYYQVQQDLILKIVGHFKMTDETLGKEISGGNHYGL